ncbi:hypothetical protein K443DRAFT_401943 [Laccaria amethystina LaAM-08-1]|uniref:Uncharacterized protein n=1 Tax=Laccaria amethystina LaAM-08-1 TaxID=1095629 RepID=A0A0C9WX35_9AGAR|nr:hypothetical protein K443DRAFT_401943 [Laccaria amethystina LaAM-08-1]
MFQVGERFLGQAHIWWYSTTRRFRNFLAPYELREPVTIIPNALPSSRGFKDASNLNQLSHSTSSILPLLPQQRRRIFKLPCTAYGVRELCTTVGVSLPRSLLVVVYIGSLMPFT